jgi:malonyl CoA-acyl carrier protein transacylase
METIAGMGTTRCLEVGHGSMLATLAKRIVPDLPVHGVATPEDLPALTEVR